MAETNYTNPTSVRPEYGWKPQGFLAGMNYASDRQRYEDMGSLQDYMMKNQAVKSGVELSDFMSDAPVRESKRLSDIATNKATAENIGAFKSGEARKVNLEADLASGSLASTIAERAAAAAIKGGEASSKEFERAAAMASALSKAAGSGPEALSRVMEHLKTSGANPQIMQFFSQARDVKQLKAMADAVNQGLTEASSKYKEHMDGLRLQEKTRIQVEHIKQAGALRVAQERAKQKEKSFDQILVQIGGKRPDIQMPYLRMIMQDPDATPEQKGKATTMYEQARKIAEAELDKNKNPEYPGLPKARPTDLSPGGNRSETNTGIPGVTRLD